MVLLVFIHVSLSGQDSVSVHRPGFYSQRFRNFMSNTVFKKVPSRKWLLSSSDLISFWHFEVAEEEPCEKKRILFGFGRV